MSERKLTDEDVYERLHAAFLAIGLETAETKLGEATLETARQAMISLQIGLLQAQESGSDQNSAIRDQAASGPSPRSS